MSAKKLIGSAALAFLFLAGTASAQTSTSSTSTVGTPNTGVGGGAASNMILLGSTAAIALAGLAYLSRRTQSE